MTEGSYATAATASSQRGPSRRRWSWLTGALSMLVAAAALVAWTPQAAAFEQYSVSRTAGNCADCHGGFRVFPYISNKDGTN